jgi:hypothetical protein
MSRCSKEFRRALAPTIGAVRELTDAISDADCN